MEQLKSQIDDTWEELKLNHMHLENPAGYTEWGYTSWETPIPSESLTKETSLTSQKKAVVEEKSCPLKENEKTCVSQ